MRCEFGQPTTTLMTWVRRGEEGRFFERGVGVAYSMADPVLVWDT